MDNLTHSLLGVALAELIAPEASPKAQRRAFFVAGIVSANLPDIDLLYAGRAAPQLGFLLHHRGHTHTLVGVVVQALLLGALLQLAPSVRRLASAPRGRLWTLVAIGLLSHLWLDSWNSYGVHPFHPFDSRWYYGDAVFIFEPWLWLLLGVAAAWNARGRVARWATVVLLAIAFVAVSYRGALSGGMLATLAAAATLLAWGVRSLAARTRAAGVLVAACLFVVGMFGLSHLARAETKALLAERAGSDIVDVILSPDPAAPWCWTAITVERNEAASEYVLRRGTLSLSPVWQPPARCASHRLVSGPVIGTSGAGRLLWRDEIHQPLANLRDLNRNDCWVQAWLQFARAPFVRDGSLRDLRFVTSPRSTFAALEIDSHPSGCPPNMTSWTPPRVDLLEPPRAENEGSVGSP